MHQVDLPTVMRDGGYRSLAATDTVARYQHLIDPLFGPIVSLETFSSFGYFLCRALYRPSASSEIRLCIGKGKTRAQAQASAICEALERCSAYYQGNEIIVQASYRDLKALALHPNACDLFSDDQYQNRSTWNTKAEREHLIPERFPESEMLSWSPLWSLTRKIECYLPTSFLYAHTPASLSSQKYCAYSSNGSAAGNTLEEAILQGLCELIERDAVAIWWYHRLQKPKIQFQNSHLWVLDLTTDLGIPVFAAISNCLQKETSSFRLGFGCHPDPEIALSRAIAELYQMNEVSRLSPRFRQWFDTLSCTHHDYLYPGKQPVRQLQDFPMASGNILKDLHKCQTILENKNMEILILDQTRSDLGLAVAKVIVPGLRHFWPRFAPGRLYDLPVQMGWLTQTPSETELNPLGMLL